MMGRQTVYQRQLFYLFNLEERIPVSIGVGSGPRIGIQKGPL